MGTTNKSSESLAFARYLRSQRHMTPSEVDEAARKRSAQVRYDMRQARVTAAAH